MRSIAFLAAMTVSCGGDSRGEWSCSGNLCVRTEQNCRELAIGEGRSGQAAECGVRRRVAFCRSEALDLLVCYPTFALCDRDSEKVPDFGVCIGVE